MRPISRDEMTSKWMESDNTVARMKEVKSFISSGVKLAELDRFIPSIQSEVQIYRKCFARMGYADSVRVHVNNKRIIAERINK